MNNLALGRQEFLRLFLFGGLLSISGCSYASSGPVISLPKSSLPKECLQSLPSRWKYEFLEVNSKQNLCQAQVAKDRDLILLGDGWLNDCPSMAFQKIELLELNPLLNNKAIAFLKMFDDKFSSKLVPVAFSPWVMIFLGEKDLVSEAKDSWEILLDPQLRGKVILPKSPRLVIELARQMSNPDALGQLKKQVKSFDDRNSLNWLRSGEASVAVLPLQFCLKALSSDLRLSVVLPKNGAPLNWTLLLQPSSSSEPFPFQWIKKLWRDPLLLKMLGNGLIPPVPYSQLTNAINFLPRQYQTIYQLEQSIEKSWSLSPLSIVERKVLEELWLNSSP